MRTTRNLWERIQKIVPDVCADVPKSSFCWGPPPPVKLDVFQSNVLWNKKNFDFLCYANAKMYSSGFGEHCSVSVASGTVEFKLRDNLFLTVRYYNEFFPLQNANKGTITVLRSLNSEQLTEKLFRVKKDWDSDGYFSYFHQSINSLDFTTQNVVDICKLFKYQAPDGTTVADEKLLPVHFLQFIEAIIQHSVIYSLNHR